MSVSILAFLVSKYLLEFLYLLRCVYVRCWFSQGVLRRGGRTIFLPPPSGRNRLGVRFVGAAVAACSRSIRGPGCSRASGRCFYLFLFSDGFGPERSARGFSKSRWPRASAGWWRLEVPCFVRLRSVHAAGTVRVWFPGLLDRGSRVGTKGARELFGRCSACAATVGGVATWLRGQCFRFERFAPSGIGGFLPVDRARLGDGQVIRVRSVTF